MPVNIIAFLVAIVALLGKLERVPFDIPEAETEVVAGSFTEYGGRLLGMFRLCVDVEMIVGASLIAAIFLPFGLGLSPWLAFALYLLKVLLIVSLFLPWLKPMISGVGKVGRVGASGEFTCAVISGILLLVSGNIGGLMLAGAPARKAARSALGDGLRP